MILPKTWKAMLEGDRPSYPKEVHILDEVYKIRFVKHIPGEAKSTKGLCLCDKKIIYIRSTQSPLGIFDTFLHECLHAIMWDQEIEFKDEDEEEEFVRRLTPGIVSLFTHN